MMENIDFGRPIHVDDIMKLKIKKIDLIKQANSTSNEIKISSQLNMQIGADQIQSKLVNYVLLIPLFIYLESLCKNNMIFQRRQNTILNMKEASNYHSFNKRNV